MGFSAVDDWVKKRIGASDLKGLIEYQLQKARETVRYAEEHSSFYRKQLLRVSGGFNSVSELPFMFPDDIARYSPEMLCVGQSAVSRVVTYETSGTTGSSKRIFFTEGDQRAAIDFFHHGMSGFTNEGDTVLILFPCVKDGSIGKLLAEALFRLKATPVMHGIVTDFSELLEFISNKEINVIAGIPGQLLELSRLCRYRGLRINGLHSVLLSADYAANSLVNAVEKDLRCHVYEHYGLTETCFGGGVYSKERNGCHMRHCDFLFEIVDPITGAALPDGEYGEITITSLNTGAMPLIRYRTGDIASFTLNRGNFPVIGKIKGRLNDGVKLLNGQTLRIAELDEELFKIEDILDFHAAYNNGAVDIFVRSLRFNRDEIIAALSNSPLKRLFDCCKINVSRSDSGVTQQNTMIKRKIMTFPL